MKTRSLLAYLVLVFAIGWLCQGLAIRYGLSGAGRNWLLAAMWAPVLAALVSSRENRRLVRTGVRRGAWRFWPAALIAGWSFSMVQQLLLWAMHRGRWDGGMFPLAADGRGVESVHGVAMLLGVGHQSYAFFALNLVLSVTAGSLISMLIGGIGEEGGWRGILQPELESRFGLFRGTLLVGLIWGFWHLPVNLAGYNDSQHPIPQAAVIFQIHTIAMSFVLAWLVRQSRSLWPAALAHAANNTLQSGPLIVAGGWWPDQFTACLVSVLAGAIFCWLLLRRKAMTVPAVPAADAA